VATPFNNPDVRLAVAKSIDTHAYSKIIDLGVNAPSNGLFVRGTPYYSDPGYPKYDPRGAAALIRKVQHDTGKPVSFTLDGVPTPSAERSGQYLQQALQAAGMKVSLANFQQNELINNALVGKFQLAQWRQFGAVQPDLNYIFWSTTTEGPIGGLAINMARNKDP
jgi:ABC-type transport system substrate-binding protein